MTTGHPRANLTSKAADARRICVIVASTRTLRFADYPLNWLLQSIGSRARLQVLDVRDAALPSFDSVRAPALAPRGYANEAERAIGAQLDDAEGFIVIANEYNHGYTAGLKNLLDHFFVEFRHKPVAFIGYGNAGGSRAIEQLRLVAAELDMVSVREAVHILGAQMGAIRARPEIALDLLGELNPKLDAMMGALLWWADALAPARSADHIRA
jgi:NAD(P)H-dependent FMN reductase